MEYFHYYCYVCGWTQWGCGLLRVKSVSLLLSPHLHSTSVLWGWGGQHCVQGDGRWLGDPLRAWGTEPLHKQQGPFYPLWGDYVPVTPRVWAIEENNSVGVGKEGTFGEGRNVSTLGGEEEVGDSPRISEGASPSPQPGFQCWRFVIISLVQSTWHSCKLFRPSEYAYQKVGAQSPLNLYTRKPRPRKVKRFTQFRSADVSERRQDPRLQGMIWQEHDSAEKAPPISPSFIHWTNIFLMLLRGLSHHRLLEEADGISLSLLYVPATLWALFYH